MGFGTTILGKISGSGSLEASERLLFNGVIGFRGAVDGVGCSTIVQGLAHAFSDRTHKRVCVVDTHILYPAMYGLLCNPFDSDVKATLKDWFSTEVGIPERIIDTKFKRISLLGCFNRRITDVFSTTDTIKLVDDTFEVLKDLFDIILVDLSHEFTQIAMCAAIKCNKIITIIDPSATCINNLTQSLNNLAISAVPFGKFTNTIINKYSDKGYLGLSSIVAKSKLNTIGVIPYSRMIFENGARSRSNWGANTPDAGVEEFNAVIDNLLCSLVNETPLEIIDVAEREAIDEAVNNSPMKNKKKARQIEIRKREALLSERTPEEMEAIKQKRHEEAARKQAMLQRQERGTADTEEDEVDLLGDLQDLSQQAQPATQQAAPASGGRFGFLKKKSQQPVEDNNAVGFGDGLVDDEARWDTPQDDNNNNGGDF